MQPVLIYLKHNVKYYLAHIVPFIISKFPFFYLPFSICVTCQIGLCKELHWLWGLFNDFPFIFPTIRKILVFFLVLQIMLFLSIFCACCVLCRVHRFLYSLNHFLNCTYCSMIVKMLIIS